MRSLAVTVLALAFAVMSAACDNGSSTTSPTTTVTLTTDTFMGTVDPGGSAFNSFNVAQQGEVDITLTAAGPPATIYMGLGVGTPTSTTTGTTTTTTCALIAGATTQTQAGTTPQLVGTASAGPLCVAVFDIGNQAAGVTISYTVTVAHP